MNKNYINFLLIDFFKNIKSHLGIIAISVLIIFLLSATLFISSSIKYSINNFLSLQPDFVVYKNRGGKILNLPTSYVDKILEIYGVSEVTPRVYGRYYFNKQNSALIIGIDFLDEQASKELKKIIKNINLKDFLNGNKMIIGSGVKSYFSKNFYKDEYNFLTPKGDFLKVKIYKTLQKSQNLIANDVIIMQQNLAKKILGIKQENCSDIALNVPNDNEWQNVQDKLSALDYDILVVNKNEVKKEYENLFNYKSGFFLILYLIAITTFVLILYQRYSSIQSTQKRNLGILRSLGWSIKDILKFKFLESLLLVLFSFIIGVSLAYIFVFILGAPILKNIFVTANYIVLTPIIDFSVLATIFLIYSVPFFAAVLIPVWKIAVTEPKEAMK
jgi:ABC-type lipoprotein release transport system permease subunit